MPVISNNKATTADFMDNMAGSRDRWIKRNRYYYQDLLRFFKFHIPENSSILEIGCGTGFLLNALKPHRGLGIDISYKMIAACKQNFAHLEFLQMDCEELSIDEKFDFVIISDTMGYFEDIQKAFYQLQKVCHGDTRIIITFQSFLWLPLLNLAELLRLKMPSKRLNWLNHADIANLLYLTDFDLIKSGRRFLLPIHLPLISPLLNKYLAHFPLINRFCLTNYIVARKTSFNGQRSNPQKVSVIVPARNEKGNIENVLRRMPDMGKKTEVIFVEGGSEDGTLAEIEARCRSYDGNLDVKWAVQDGKGKGDAVRKGASLARGDIMMILDADLAVAPEELPKFYDAIASGKGEYVNGSRLTYPMEKEAMRLLNILGNRFFSGMFSWLLGQRLKDTLCGTKAISMNNWNRLAANRKYFGDFDPFGDFDLIFGSAKLGLKMVEVPIRYSARKYGTTNISRFRHGWLLLKMVFFAMNKLKFR